MKLEIREYLHEFFRPPNNHHPHNIHIFLHPLKFFDWKQIGRLLGLDDPSNKHLLGSNDCNNFHIL